MNIKRNTEVDILYNLLTYINASYSQGIYYTICYQVLNNIEKIILNNNCYITPKIDLKGDNYPAIYGEMIYLYLTAIEFREN